MSPLTSTSIQTSATIKQTSLKDFSNIYDRILELCNRKNIAGVQELAKKLGYKHPEKIYRLGRGQNTKPSIDIIEDLSNLFVDLNLRWLISGKGPMLLADEYRPPTEKEPPVTKEPDPVYSTDLKARIEEKDYIISLQKDIIQKLKNDLNIKP